MNNSNLKPEKYFYWIKSSQLEDSLDYIKKKLQKDQVPQAKQRPCEGLNPTFPILHIPPEIWSANCSRQASWYRTSDICSDHLIISRNELEIPNIFLSGSIYKIEVELNNKINPELISHLIDTPEFKTRAPKEWFHLLEREIPLFEKYLAKNNCTLSLDSFLEYHSANHANFLLAHENVVRNVEMDGEAIPCSLFSSIYICSACLELFGVIGRHLPKKILKNCPGLKYYPLSEKEYFLSIIDFPN